MRASNRGFTLVEIIMVIAIIAIIGAFALPAYQNNVMKSRRVDAQGALMGLANAMERYYSQNNTYENATLGNAGIFPDQSPLDGSTKYYNIALASATATAYTATATPIGSQAGDGQLSLDSTGTREWNSLDDGSGSAKSW
jgi:type IV pilus assembly protein PilE